MSKKSNRSSAVQRDTSSANLTRDSEEVCGLDACAEDVYTSQAVRELLDGSRLATGFDIEQDLSNSYLAARRRDAGFILLAYLLRASPDERHGLLVEIQAEWFTSNIARFLYSKIQQHTCDGQLDLDSIQAAIEDCGPEVFGQALNPTLRMSVYQWWFATLATAPTYEQAQRAKSILAGASS